MGIMSSKPQAKLYSEFYYKNLTDTNSMNDTPKQQVQLSFVITDAESFSNYQIKIFSSADIEPKKYSIISSTEVKIIESYNNSNQIVFNFSLIIDYFFEKQQFLNFQLNKNNKTFDNFVTLGFIMGSRGQTVSRNIEKSDKLIITAQPLQTTNMSFELKLMFKSLDNLDLSKRKSLYYVLSKTNNSKKINLYKSEVIPFLNRESYFKNLLIPVNILCNEKYDQPITIDIYHYQNNYLIGSYQTTPNDLLNQSDTNFQFNTRGQHKLYFYPFVTLRKQTTFMDYLKGGMQLSLSIGIDFTASNGKFQDPNSLHYVGTQFMNYYERAIRRCGDILAYYDYDQLFPVYGYGAQLPNMGQVNHCFNLNFQNDPNINCIDNVLATYRNNINFLRFSGPTLFAPLINTTISTIKSGNNSLVYHILLILTDGVINDMSDTIDALVEASYLPLSVIIIGVGKADFSNMVSLDADDAKLIDGRGRESARDLVQFVPFNQFETNDKLLAENVLEEIPRQVEEYYRMVNFYPNNN